MIYLQLLIQSVAIIALGLFSFSFHAKSRAGILAWQLASLIAWTVHFSLLSAWTGAALNVVNTSITLLFLLRGKQEEKTVVRSKNILYISLGVLIIATLLTWEDYFSIFALLGVVFITLSKWQKEPRKIRQIAIAASVFWILYDAFVGSYGGIIAETIIIVSIIASLMINKPIKQQRTVVL